MPVTTAIAAVAGVAVAGASAVSQASQAKKAGKQAKAAQEEGLANQARLEGEAKDRIANEESEATAIATRNTAKQRQRARSVGAGGRQDTILTGPGGDDTVSAGGKKTLLGT